MTDPDRDPIPDVAFEPGVRGANLLLMFVLEMAVYVAAAWLAASLSVAVAVRVILAVVLVAGFAAVWGLFGAPRAVRPARGWARVTLEVLWFGAGAGAFALAGRPTLGVALAILVAINLALRWHWRQTPTLP